MVLASFALCFSCLRRSVKISSGFILLISVPFSLILTGIQQGVELDLDESLATSETATGLAEKNRTLALENETKSKELQSAAAEAEKKANEAAAAKAAATKQAASKAALEEAECAKKEAVAAKQAAESASEAAVAASKRAAKKTAAAEVTVAATPAVVAACQFVPIMDVLCDVLGVTAVGGASLEVAEGSTAVHTIANSGLDSTASDTIGRTGIADTAAKTAESAMTTEDADTAVKSAVDSTGTTAATAEPTETTATAESTETATAADSTETATTADFMGTAAAAATGSIGETEEGGAGTASMMEAESTTDAEQAEVESARATAEEATAAAADRTAIELALSLVILAVINFLLNFFNAMLMLIRLISNYILPASSGTAAEVGEDVNETIQTAVAAAPETSYDQDVYVPLAADRVTLVEDVAETAGTVTVLVGKFILSVPKTAYHGVMIPLHLVFGMIAATIAYSSFELIVKFHHLIGSV